MWGMYKCQSRDQFSENIVTGTNRKNGQGSRQEGSQINGTKKIKYLGYIIAENAYTEEEIKIRLAQTRNCVRQLHSIILKM